MNNFKFAAIMAQSCVTCALVVHDRIYSTLFILFAGSWMIFGILQKDGK